MHSCCGGKNNQVLVWSETDGQLAVSLAAGKKFTTASRSLSLNEPCGENGRFILSFILEVIVFLVTHKHFTYNILQAKKSYNS